jgi:hypothetical protein
MSEEQHHPYGFSRWPALMACAHYQSSGGTSPEATRGTIAHAALAVMIKAREEIPFADERLPVLSGREYDSVAWAFRWVRDASKGFAAEVLSEFRVELKSGPCKGVFGTLDVAIFDGVFGDLVVADFKLFGDGGKDHAPQLSGYAAAVCDTIGFCRMEPKMFVLDGEKREAVEVWLNVADDLCVEIADRIDRRNEYRRNASPWCKYCKHSASCPEQMKVVAAATAITPINATRDQLIARPELAARKLAIVEQVEMWCEAARKECREIADVCGGVLADRDNGLFYEVRTLPGNRKISDILVVAGVMLDCGFAHAEILALCSLPVGKVEDALRANTGKTKREVAALLSGCVERGEDKVTFGRAK